MKNSPNIYGIILASGFSRRMGEQKLLLGLNNNTLLGVVLEKVELSKLKGIHTIVPKYDNKRIKVAKKYNNRLVLNTQPEFGMGYSLALGIKSLPGNVDAVIVMLADQPEIKIDDINRVYDCFANQHYLSNNPEVSKVIIQTNYEGRWKSHPILFSRHFYEELSRLNGDHGGRNVIKNNPIFLNTVNSSNQFPDDIDTPEDYYRLCSRYNQSKLNMHLK